MAFSMQIDPPSTCLPMDEAKDGNEGAAEKPQAAKYSAQERRRLEAVTEILGGWVWETDSEHRFTYMSPSVARLAGKRPEKHYGRTLEQLGILDATTSSGLDWIAKRDAHQPIGPVDFVRYDNGKPFFMRTTGRPQFDEAGNFSGYVGIAYALSDAQGSETVDRRGATRRRTIRAAEIKLPNDSSPISCVLVDISTTGARLLLPDGLELPDTFELSVAGLTLSARCTVCWHKDSHAGVAFTD